MMDDSCGWNSGKKITVAVISEEIREKNLMLSRERLKFDHKQVFSRNLYVKNIDSSAVEKLRLVKEYASCYTFRLLWDSGRRG